MMQRSVLSVGVGGCIIVHVQSSDDCVYTYFHHPANLLVFRLLSGIKSR